MDRRYQLAFLIDALLAEMPEYREQAGQFPPDDTSQRRLLRSLMNVRPPMPLDRDDQRTVGEQVYCRVDYPGIKTLADLRGYLKSLFSDGLVEELLPVDGTQYVELDGALYTIDGGRGADITKGEETVQVLRDGTPGRCTVRVTVEVLDPQQGFSVVGSETHDFLYEQVGERWIFTTFSMVR